MIRELRVAIVVFLLLTVVTGVVYPGLVTLVAAVAFPERAGGSLVHAVGKLVGSRLIGQSFSSPQYFWGRPRPRDRCRTMAQCRPDPTRVP